MCEPRDRSRRPGEIGMVGDGRPDQGAFGAAREIVAGGRASDAGRFDVGVQR